MAEYKYQLEGFDSKVVSIRSPRKEQEATDVGRKPCILMVGMHLTKTRGGITTLAAGILNSALKKDYDLKYIASQAEDFGRFRKMLLAVTSAIRFIAICILRRPDLVYVHMGSNASLYRESVFILLGKLLGKSVLTHFHAGDLDNYYPIQPRIGQKFIKDAIGLSDRLIAVSQESARQLRNLNHALSIAVIPNVIDTSAFLDCVSKEDSGHRNETVKLLFVGACGKLKGEKDLINALALLKDDGLALKVSVVGYGAENLRSMCEERGIADLVDHLGAVPMDERIAFYEQADIFVLPTYAEAMPISVIEAMAAGLPVITTAVGGIPELIDDGQEGLLFPKGNVEVLAQKISFLMKNKDARLAMGKKAQRRVREQMDFATYVERLRAELLRVCEIDNRI